MALNASGPISLGGATTGQSINLELGQTATTQVSLNDTNVRALAGVTTPLSTIVVPVDFWGKSSESFWIARISFPYGGFPSADTNQTISVDSSGNIYISSSIAQSATVSASNVMLYLWKMSSDGNVLWSKRIYRSTGGSGAWSAAVHILDESASCIYNFEQAPTTTTNSVQYTRIRKYDLNGNYVSEPYGFHRPNNSSTSVVVQIGSAVKLSDGTFAASYGRGRGSVTRYNSSLSAMTYSYAAGTNSEQYTVSEIPGANSLFLVAGSGWAKVNMSTGASEGQFSTSSSATGYASAAAAFANSNGLYCLGRCITGNPTGFGYQVYKLNTSLGVVAKTKLVTTLEQQARGQSSSIDDDASGNIYMVTQTVQYYTMQKYDANLNLQWQRSISLSTFNPTIPGLKVVGNTMYINLGDIVLKLKTDGTGTGTYSVGGITVTYSATTFSVVDPSITPSAPTTWLSVVTATTSLSLDTDAPTITRTLQSV